MVQWIWTSRDKTLLSTVAWVNLTSGSRSRLHRYMTPAAGVMPMMPVPPVRFEVDFSGQYFPVAHQSVLRDGHVVALDASDVLGTIETEEPAMREKKQEKREPKKETNQHMRKPKSHGAWGRKRSERRAWRSGRI